MAFKEPKGWVLADYKTDKVENNLEALLSFYRPQVEMYREFWEEISGERVAEAGLYFADSMDWVII